MIIETFAGLKKALEAYSTALSSYSLFLFKSNSTPDVNTVFTDLTEADFSGYGRVGLGSFTAPTEVDETVTAAAVTLATFTHNGGGTDNDIYGWGVVDGSDIMYMCERFPGAPITMEPGANPIIVRPELTYENKTP